MLSVLRVMVDEKASALLTRHPQTMTPTSSNSGMNTSPTTMTGKVMRWTMLLSRFVFGAR